MPSTLNPVTWLAIAFWKARTDASVFGPNRPSTASVRPSFRFRKLIWSWTARTTEPALPCFTVTTSARQVGAWTTPEPPRPSACWKATTAALVFGPNIPSTVSLAPCAFSRYCRERTVTFGQALLLPCHRARASPGWQPSSRRTALQPANPIDYQSIVDVLLTIEYSALVSADYRQLVIRRLDRQFTGDRSFSIREQFPDTWYDLNNPDTVDDPARLLAVDLPLTTADFPPNLTEPALEQLTLFVVGANGMRQDLTVRAAGHAVGAQVTTAGPVTAVGGVVGTRRPDGAPWLGFVGSDPPGDWQFTLEDTPGHSDAVHHRADPGPSPAVQPERHHPGLALTRPRSARTSSITVHERAAAR
jgi:hypothetical protein